MIMTTTRQFINKYDTLKNIILYVKVSNNIYRQQIDRDIQNM